MKWHITYYNDKVYSLIRQWPLKIQARFVALTDVMLERGPDLGMPHTRVIDKGLFELRIKAQGGIARVFYFINVGNEIVMLHGFIKKAQKTPLKELRLANKRLREIKRHA